MIDEKTQRKIHGMSGEMPKRLMKGLVENKIVYDKRDDALAIASLVRKRGGENNRNVADKLEKLVKTGAFHHEKNYVDHTKDKERKKFIDTKIEQGFKSGKLKRPDMKEYNAFLERIQGKK